MIRSSKLPTFLELLEGTLCVFAEVLWSVFYSVKARSVCVGAKI